MTSNAPLKYVENSFFFLSSSSEERERERKENRFVIRARKSILFTDVEAILRRFEIAALLFGEYQAKRCIHRDNFRWDSWEEGEKVRLLRTRSTFSYPSNFRSSNDVMFIHSVLPYFLRSATAVFDVQLGQQPNEIGRRKKSFVLRIGFRTFLFFSFSDSATNSFVESSIDMCNQVRNVIARTSMRLISGRRHSIFRSMII